MDLDSKLLREVFGRFGTGVTVCTAANGTVRRGMTANSFTSVSLNPPLVLICVDERRTIHNVIRDAAAFGVNILRQDQRQIANYFAGKPPVDLLEEHDRLFGLPFHSGVTGAPLLDDCLASLDCSLYATYPGGDHSIFVGRVEHVTTSNLNSSESPLTPLLWFESNYYQLGPLS